jgi:hypothetical protein
MAESTYNEISNWQFVLITVGRPISNPYREGVITSPFSTLLIPLESRSVGWMITIYNRRASLSGSRNTTPGRYILCISGAILGAPREGSLMRVLLYEVQYKALRYVRILANTHNTTVHTNLKVLYEVRQMGLDMRSRFPAVMKLWSSWFLSSYFFSLCCWSRSSRANG